MKIPKKKTLTLWDGHTSETLIKAEYISVYALKEWINQQAEKNNESVGALSLLVRLETFINSE